MTEEVITPDIALNIYFTDEELDHFRNNSWDPMARWFCGDEIAKAEREYIEARRLYLSFYECVLGEQCINRMHKQTAQTLKKIRRQCSSDTAYVNSLLSKTKLLKNDYLGGGNGNGNGNGQKRL